MTVIDGQTSIFDALEPEYPTFTATTGPGKYDVKFCGYCHTTKQLNEGGAGPAGKQPGYAYWVCEPCADKHHGNRTPLNQWVFQEIP